jgi:hypothetical protein
MCKEYPGVPLNGLVRGDLLDSMSKAYANDLNKSKVNFNPDQPNASVSDALSVSFDLDKIKNFIYKMDSATCNCDSTKAFGIRFYYIKYTPSLLNNSALLSQDDPLWGLINANQNKHSLAMVPVYKNISGGDWHDFDINSIGKNCTFQPMGIKYLNKVTQAGIVIGSGDNHGGIGPPPEPGTYPSY